MESLNETLLASWVRLSTSVINNRLVPDLSYNESVVCHYLYRNLIFKNKENLTASMLCEKTHILKSQMNRILNRLEEKQMITRKRSTTDKRKVYITFNLEQAKEYKKQHEKIITMLNNIIERIGREAAEDAIRIFDTVSNVADELIH